MIRTMVKLLSWLIRRYQVLISPLLGPHCRFHPSCSGYFLQALEQHGLLQGTLLGMKRICRCHPLSEGGLDPVPPPKNHEQCSHAADEMADHVKVPASHGY